jgi:hypothetical protein
MTSGQQTGRVTAPWRRGFAGNRLLLPLLGVGLVGMPTVGQAAVVSGIAIIDPFLQYYNVGPNDLRFSTGEFIRYGATSVTPNGTAGTTGTASTTNSATGGSIVRGMNFFPSPAVPNFFSGSLSICTTSCSPTANNNPANLQGPWTIGFQNPSASPTTASATLSLAGAGEIPFVNSVTLSGTSAQPTFSWTPPAGLHVDGYRINIYQNNIETFNPNGSVANTGQVTNRNVGPGITSYTVTSADFTHGVALQDNTTYTIEISILQTRDGSTTNLANNNVSAISRVYSTFQTLPQGAPPVVLPTTTSSGVYTFNLTVEPGITYNIDPAVATGYIYQIGAGDPKFASVSLPNIGNPNPYSLYLWNGASYVFDTTLAGGSIFDFGGIGVSQFEVLGIDPLLGLDPTNPTAFITALTFKGPGTFTGTMTAVTTDVPEPGSVALLLSGLLGLGWFRSRHRVG